LRSPRPPRHSSSPAHSHLASSSVCQVYNMKRKYDKAKDQLKGFLRPRSRQSALSVPARSPRSSQELATTQDHGIPTTSSAIVRADTPSAGAFVPEVTPEPFPHSEARGLSMPADDPILRIEDTQVSSLIDVFCNLTDMFYQRRLSIKSLLVSCACSV